MAQDSTDLEALFEQVAAQREKNMASQQADPGDASEQGSQADTAPADPASHTLAAQSDQQTSAEILHRIGHLTRSLHDALRELGFTEQIRQTVGTMPDARARLDYIASLTGNAAERVLEYVEIGQSMQEELRGDVVGLSQRWQQVFARQVTLEEFRQTAMDTRTALERWPRTMDATHRLLTDVMMAQDFHDLTGQIIKRVASILQNVEVQLLQLLIEYPPPSGVSVMPRKVDLSLHGPAIPGDARGDVMTSQAQVDELLASLGF